MQAGERVDLCCDMLPWPGRRPRPRAPSLLGRALRVLSYVEQGPLLLVAFLAQEIGQPLLDDRRVALLEQALEELAVDMPPRGRRLWHRRLPLRDACSRLRGGLQPARWLGPAAVGRLGRGLPRPRLFLLEGASRGASPLADRDVLLLVGPPGARGVRVVPAFAVAPQKGVYRLVVHLDAARFLDPHPAGVPISCPRLQGLLPGLPRDARLRGCLEAASLRRDVLCRCGLAVRARAAPEVEHISGRTPVPSLLRATRAASGLRARGASVRALLVAVACPRCPRCPASSGASGRLFGALLPACDLPDHVHCERGLNLGAGVARGHPECGIAFCCPLGCRQQTVEGAGVDEPGARVALPDRRCRWHPERLHLLMLVHALYFHTGLPREGVVLALSPRVGGHGLPGERDQHRVEGGGLPVLALPLEGTQRGGLPASLILGPGSTQVSLQLCCEVAPRAALVGQGRLLPGRPVSVLPGRQLIS